MTRPAFFVRRHLGSPSQLSWLITRSSRAESNIFISPTCPSERIHSVFLNVSAGLLRSLSAVFSVKIWKRTGKHELVCFMWHANEIHAVTIRATSPLNQWWGGPLPPPQQPRLFLRNESEQLFSEGLKWEKLWSENGGVFSELKSHTCTQTDTNEHGHVQTRCWKLQCAVSSCQWGLRSLAYLNASHLLSKPVA